MPFPGIRAAVAALLTGGLLSASAATYYVDPATGSMAFPGTSSSPWSTLEDVFTANKIFAPGDVILLRTGYHGSPQIKGVNASLVTIQPDTGATPKVKKLVIKTAANWLISGLDICPQNAGASIYDTGRLVDVQGTASDITVKNCLIRAASDITGWTATQWQTLLTKGSNAVYVAGPRTTISGNVLQNVSFGICVTKTAPFAVISGNTITAFYNDAIRGLADDCVFEYNTVQDSYVADDNHDDFFQSWSTDASGAVGKGTVYRLTLRGNTFISRRDSSQPLYSPPQGIGCFDGMFEGWVVENNLIVSQTYHGIALYGAINCRVVNNTVVENPLDGTGAVRPWITLPNHKNNADGSPWPVPPSGNIARNNITSKPVSIVAGGGVADHNQTTTAYTTYFADYSTLNFALLSTAPAVNAGDSNGAPTIDIRGKTRTAPIDVGAYEYSTSVYEGFDYAATTNVSAASDSASDSGWTGTTWTGGNDIVTPGLTVGGYNTLGNALQFTANVGSVRALALSTLPAGLTQVDSDGVTRLGKPGTTIWLRFLIRADAADASGSLTAGLNLNGAASGGTTKLRIGDTGTTTTWSLIKGATVGASTAPITTGNTVVLVARVSFIAGINNDEVDLFINPPAGPTAPASPSATLRNLDIGTIDRVEIKGNRTSTIDEIALSDGWSSL